MKPTLIAFTALLLMPIIGHAGCTVSASGISFGTYNTTVGAPNDTTGTITLNCTAASGTGVYNIALNTGMSGNYSTRRMSSGSATMPYQLYLDAARTQVWGDGTSGTSVAVGVDTVPLIGGNSVHQIYGRIPPRLNLRPGAYTDTLIVTVTY